MKLVRILFTILIVLLLATTSAFASNTDTVTPGEALKAAKSHVFSDIKKDAGSGWRGGKVTISSPEKVFDTQDELGGYLFNIKVNGKDSGYVFVGSSRTDYPILSFSYEGTVWDEIQRNYIKQGIREKIKHEKLINAGPGRFALKIDTKNGKKVFKSPNGQELIIEQDNSNSKNGQPLKEVERAKAFWKAVVGDIGTNNDGVTNDDPNNWESGYNAINRNFISNVPDLNQWKHDGTNWSGCSPTSGSNVIAYWAKANTMYKNLMPSTQIDIVFALRKTMGTWQTSTGAGSTHIFNIDDGMQQYAQNQGLLKATAANYGNWLFGTSMSYQDYKNEIDLLRPTILNFNGQTFYGDHSVTGVGYKEYVYNGYSGGHQYMVIHDNWSSTPLVYVAYGRNYNYVVMTQFKPAG